MNKVLVPLLLLALVTLTLAACSVPPASSLNTAAAAPPIKLKFSYGAPANDQTQTDIFEPWAKMIADRTNAIGKPVEITFFPAAALGPKEGQYDLLTKGIADIVGNWNVQDIPGRFPLAEYTTIPFMLPGSSLVATQVMQAVYDKYPEIQKELAETKLLFFQPPAAMQFIIRDKQVKTMEDFKGLKMCMNGVIKSKAGQALGIVPVNMGLADVYSAIEKGLVDGANMSWSGAYSFKWNEVSRIRMVIPNGWAYSGLTTSMSLDTWKKLPPDVQAIFTELSGMHMAKFAGTAMDKAAQTSFDAIVAYDKKVGNPAPYNISDSEFARWKAAVDPVVKDWAADLDNKGMPATALLSDIPNLIKQYSSQ